MSKFGRFEEYPRDGLASAQRALLTAWRSLERYHDDLVLNRDRILEEVATVGRMLLGT